MILASGRNDRCYRFPSKYTRIFSSQLNAKILLARKENDVEELRRRVEEAKIKLGSEMKVCSR